MRYGILSDIHGNLPALEAVLAALRSEGVDQYLCLGDIVGYGPFPNECCEVIRELNCIVVRGNHDEAATTPGKEVWFTWAARTCILWTREVLTEENKSFLSSLEPVKKLDDIVLCHGSVPDPDFYTTTPLEAMLTFRVLDRPICLFGHTHYAGWFEYDPASRELPAQYSAPNGARLTLREGLLYMLNPGGAGQPRDGNSCAAYAILDTDEKYFEIKRTPYNIAETQQAIIEAGLPEAMAARLDYGI